MNLGKENETLEFKKSTGKLKDAMDDICDILNKHVVKEFCILVLNQMGMFAGKWWVLVH
ncbi:hypothetical protein [Mycoplasmopsis arginini]|uniref:hypothetical protein n=1 Tax=Mycoplasmopsis arginini TaxID=2094 RepID=UPI00249F3303|nr:hypothetical protein [Mycoplasmopsis arginini]MCY2903189.1 putative DNA binding domain-containing protein [Mycoplasmopsis arginini QMP CG1-2758]MDI3349102.1 hypothetical protein [Mycoplasmopsis arginini]MDI3350288.1 hypothetical protein [Mycoplasmopsis arginini]MDI3350923.1 hypothetical protein [Mycoplasmopsis arginini]MDI3351510.1 hypothetical protein [Mycoplasmopsis arginini]